MGRVGCASITGDVGGVGVGGQVIQNCRRTSPPRPTHSARPCPAPPHSMGHIWRMGAGNEGESGHESGTGSIEDATPPSHT